MCLRADRGVDGRIEEGYAEQQLRAQFRLRGRRPTTLKALLINSLV